MSNKENLRSFNNIPKEEHIKISQRGGINSGRKRRFRKQMAQVIDIWTRDAIRAAEKDIKALEREAQRLDETMDILTAMTEPEQMDLFEALEAELNEILSDDDAQEVKTDARA